MLERIGILRGAAGAILFLAAAFGVYEVGDFGDKALDTASPVSASQAVAFAAAGNNTLITALTIWSPCSVAPKLTAYAPDSLRNAQAAGLTPAGYFLLSPHETGRAAVDRVYASTPSDVWDAMVFVAVDFEVPSVCYPAYAIPYSTIVSALDRLEELGKPRVLYTSCNEWRNHLVPSNPAKPRDTWLWNASWDGDARVNYERCPFGGWTIDEVLLEQYTGGTPLAGVYVDNNNIRFLIAAAPKDATPEATPASPPSYAPECWGEGYDPSWHGRWNVCDAVWVGPQGHFVDPSTWAWYFANGAPMEVQ